MVDVRLPQALQSALADLVSTSRNTRARAENLSLAYRAERPSQVAVADRDDAVAYAVSRMPATYAAVAAALAETLERLEEFAPATLLDAGAGPGTASWAAVEALPTLRTMVQLDHNRGLLTLGRRLAETSAALAGVEQVSGDLARPPLSGRHFDLAVAAYALTELPDAHLIEAAQALWAACDGVLLVVEPGRSRDYGRLLRVRAALFEAGAKVIAPCPHERSCPLPAGDWCHFNIRLPRSRAHRQAKGGALGYEDEKFSYLAVGRPGVAIQPAAARVLRPPVVRKFEVELSLCTRAGLETRHVPKQAGAAFKAAKKRDWGDAVALVGETDGA